MGVGVKYTSTKPQHPVTFQGTVGLLVPSFLPHSPATWDSAERGQYGSPTDGSVYLFVALNTQTSVTVIISDGPCLSG
jgi:hypothetical protein